jgi:hypothetical protein
MPEHLDRKPRIFTLPDQSAVAVYTEFRPTKALPIPPEGTPREDYENARYDEYVKGVFDRAVVNDTLTRSLDDTIAPRVVVAWRLTRTFARILGLLYIDEYLCEMAPEAWGLSPQGDPNRVPYYHPARLKSIVYDGNVGIRPPNNDQYLVRWCDTLAHAAEELGINMGSKDFPDIGYHGLRPLLNRDTARMAWPTREQLYMFEQILVEDTLQKMTDTSVADAREWVRSRYGVTAHEANEVIKLGRREGVAYAESTPEEDKALMVLRLEKLYSQAQIAYDTRAARGVLKDLALVQGITRTEIENPFDNVVEVLGKVREKQKSLPPPSEEG